jgi:hypothetical protein
MISPSISVHGPLDVVAASNTAGTTNWVQITQRGVSGYGDLTIHVPDRAFADALSFVIKAIWPDLKQEG